MIQNFSAYSCAPNVEQLILERKPNDRVDPLILYHCFDSVHRGEQTNLAKARKACGLDKITDSRVLPVTCLEKTPVAILGLRIRVESESKNPPINTDSSSSLQFFHSLGFSLQIRRGWQHTSIGFETIWQIWTTMRLGLGGQDGALNDELIEVYQSIPLHYHDPDLPDLNLYQDFKMCVTPSICNK